MKFLNFPVLTALSGDPGTPGAGTVYINSTTGLKWFNSAWSTAMDLESAQTVAGAKTFGVATVFQGAVTQTGAGVANFNGGDLQYAGRSVSRGVVSNGYAQIVASSTGTTSTSAVVVAGLSVTVTLDSTRRYRVSSWGQVASTVASDRIGIALYDSATQLVGTFVQVPSAPTGYPYYLEKIVTAPTSGSHTITVDIYRNAGTGTVNAVGGATAPSYVMVEDIGQAA